ncbi:MAG: ABC transporter permease [Spirochaetales bacterium]|nr:ABC transporter permease [Spirochaetales bacterium]
MRAYITRRLLYLIPTLFGVTIILFFVVQLIPGDVIDRMQQVPDIKLDREELERQLGLDKPLIVQYARWMGFIPDVNGEYTGIMQGDLGQSHLQKTSVIQLVSISWPITLELGLFAFIIAQALALPIGTYSAIRQDRIGDYVARSFSILAVAVPSFWLGTMVMIFPALWWDYMPPMMIVRFFDDPLENIRMFFAPVIVLGLSASGASMRITRTQVLEVLRQDYIRTAWAKGFTERVVIIRHALKNALIPVISGMGLQVPVLIGGTVIIEDIFCLPGMGRLIINSLLERDKELTCGVILIFGFVLVFINLLVDLSYAFFDPRVQYK